MVKETELGANNGKRKLVSLTTLTPKLNYKPKPKALSPTKHTKAQATILNANQPKPLSSSLATWLGQASTSLNTLPDPSLPFEHSPSPS